MMKKRRSYYAIKNESPLSNEAIENLLKEVITFTPSAFHSQSSRVVLLLHEDHKALWDIVKDTLKKIVPVNKFSATEEKIHSFSAGYGTVLFFEDMKTIEQLQKDFPLYADNFPVWSMQSSGMLQYNVWTALSNEGLKGSLQHYNPLIDDAVHAAFHINKDWKLIAEMPFGTVISEVEELVYKPMEERFIVFGDKS